MISALSPGLRQNQVPAVHRGKQVLIFPRESENKTIRRSSEQDRKARTIQTITAGIVTLPSSTHSPTHHTRPSTRTFPNWELWKMPQE